MFSGYIPVDDKGSRRIFYWYVQTHTNFDTAPLFFWTNGGPGCSGLLGLLTEMGPFQTMENGTLRENPFARTNLANMIFVEAPAGVGFSTIKSGSDYHYVDQSAATDNWVFIQKFLERYPRLKPSPFYLSSESYG